ncbi:MAG: ATP-binding protein [Prevotella sp.]|nr:ATP-binding protein [Prevotella sp.]
MMNKEMILTTRQSIWQAMADKMNYFSDVIIRPIEMLRDYYSLVLERNLNMRQTWALIEAQAAFFLGILPVGYAFILRAVALVWFIIALKKCRKLLA